jgi:hypothetical protein
VHVLAEIVGALALGAAIKLLVRLCGHRITWRLAVLIALVVVFST